MDTNEIIALLIVALAVLILIRYYRKNSKRYCGPSCFVKRKKSEK